MEKFAEQVTQQLANDINTAVNIKLAAFLRLSEPVKGALGFGAINGAGGALSGLISGGLLGAGIGTLANLGNDNGQSWDGYRHALINGAKWGAGIGAGLGGLSGATLGGLTGHALGKDIQLSR